MYKKVLVVILLAVQYVHGSTRTLLVNELIRSYCIDGMPPMDTNNTSTPQNRSFDHVLADITDNVEINITTDSTLSFHNKIMGLENVLIRGLNNPTVYCYNTTMIIGGLQFDSCTNIVIEGITWSGCGGITGSNNYPVLGFYNSSNIIIRNCSFQYSKGQAVTLSEMTGDVSVSHSIFLHNRFAGDHGGTAIHIGNQNTPHIVVTIKYCNFTNNIGSTSVVYIGQSNDQSIGLISFHDLDFSSNEGVAIYLNHQNLYMYGDFVFYNNVADKGAGMFIGSNSIVYFSETSTVEFRENNATDSGGAIFLNKHSTILLGLKSEFIDNQATNDGGAVAINDNSLITNGNSIINISNSNESLNFSACDFMEGCHMLFHNNTAKGSGGAIFVNSSSNIVFGHNSTFTANEANKGGAVAMSDNCGINNEQDSNVGFIGNTALQSGGALHLSADCHVSFANSSNVMFKENNAYDFGGAIFTEMYSNVSFTESSTVVFNNNNATFGESLYSRNTTCVTEMANVTYNNNTSQWNYGNKFLKGNDITINADGVVRCTDYTEYYICTKTQCSCKHINDVTNYTMVTITDDITFSSVINLEGLNISLVGHNNATIYYKESGLINFTSCRDLLIKNLTWNRYSEINPIPRLVFTNVLNVAVENCYFQYSKGKAIELSQVSGIVTIDHCQFLYDDIQINDHGAAIDYRPGYNDTASILTISNCCFSHTETEDVHSLIYLEDSKNESDMVIIHDSVFLDIHGTCIYASNQNIFIRGTVSFNNNTADNGAGIFITGHSNVTFCSNSNVTFGENTVHYNGGAIHSTDHSTITFSENSVVDFMNNEATQGGGGAIYSKTDSVIVIKGNASFSRNKAMQGGAIYSKNNSEVTFQNKSCAVFNDNEGIRNGRNGGNGGNGGSIYSDSSCIKFDGHCSITFNNNVVYNGNGGAIYSNSSDISFMGSSRVIFNKSEVFNGNGGAIFFAHESSVDFQGTSNIQFICNKATDGGALHLQNSSIDFTENSTVQFFDNEASNKGGGIYLHENNILFNDTSTIQFIGNHAKQGGALYAEMNCTIMNKGTTTVEFCKNTGEEGGGIYFISNSYLSIIGSSNITFYNNEAAENGGGIYSDMNSDIQFSSDSPIMLSKNTATQGGAIYLSDSSLVFESCVMFTENEASKHGGSVYSTSNCNIMFKGSCSVKYDKNKALNGAGGGIYCTDSSNTTFQGLANIMFTENAARDGGALYYNFESTVQFENNSMVIFSNNTATSGGAINFQVNSNGTFGGTAKVLFCNNTATTSGGAIHLSSRVLLLFEGAVHNDSITDAIHAYCTGNDAIFNNATNIFYHNNAEIGGAFFIESSTITFHSNSMFVSNKASQDGGAIYLSDQSNLTFMYSSKASFSKNDASDYGGAIYGKFSTDVGQSKINFNNASILFSKNNARIAGNSVYINLPEACNSTCLDNSILNAISTTIKHIATSPNQLKLYNPAKCIDGDDEECKVYYANNIMLGQEILLDACMYDYYDQPADAAQFLITGKNDSFTLALNATFISCNHTVPDIRINAKKGDPELPYNYSMSITLFVNRISGSKVVNTSLIVELSICHPGFWYHEESCTCYNANDIVICSGSSSTIRRGYWFGYVSNMPTVTFCPINYCNFSCCETSNGYYQLSPVRDNQCRSHRTGISCGNCDKGYVLSYDSTECINEEECTTALIALVVTLTVIYWIVLFVVVSVMMHFKFEIGYLYGLTYYYSMIDILLSQQLHFSNGLFTVVTVMSSIAKVTPQFLGRFCLFKTMSGIDQQFIHYAHPLAVSLILVMITILARFSRRLTEFISTGIIHIICFLLLLSYTSVATTSLLLMRPLIFQDIDKVYTYLSPDFEYFHGRHLGYGILAILSTIGIVICLPSLLLSEPFLNSKINFVKIKPLLDQFQGCYKDNYRSFAGYYMICRLVIITLFISNSSNDDFIIQYLLITACVMAALIHLIVRPYAHVVLNVFDGTVLHIMILVAVLPFVEHYDSFGSDMILTLAYILVLLPLTIFIIMELLLHKEDIKEMIQRCKSFKLRKEKVDNNEIQLNEVNREFGIIVDESMRKNATIVDVDQPEERLPEIPWSRDSFVEVLNEIKD